MQKEPTGAERYFAERRKEPGFEEAYLAARARIDRFDTIIRQLDEKRIEHDWSKAELGRRAGLAPEVVRRLFSARSPNPTLATLVALAESMGLEFELRPGGRS